MSRAPESARVLPWLAGSAGVLLAARYADALVGLPRGMAAGALWTVTVLALLSALLTQLLRPSLRWEIALFSAGAVTAMVLRAVPQLAGAAVVAGGAVTVAVAMLWAVSSIAHREAHHVIVLDEVVPDEVVDVSDPQIRRTQQPARAPGAGGPPGRG